MTTKLPLFLLLNILVVTMFTGTVLGQISNLPWGVERIRGDLPWDKNGDFIVDSDANAGVGIRIAVLDSGIWKDHPDLAGRIVGGISYKGEKEYWEDEIGHGTWVAGMIAAIDNGNHLIGVAPKVELLAVKLDDSSYGGLQISLKDGIKWAADNGAYIISISTGFPSPYLELENACSYAYNRGVLLVAAAGNLGGPVEYPAAYATVVAVGAVDPNDNRPSWSNYGPELELTAPGVNINSTFPEYLGSRYHNDSGTSASAPFVSGVATLTFGGKVDPDYDTYANGLWENFEVRAKLQNTAHYLGDPIYYGYGLVNSWMANQVPIGNVNYDDRVNILDLGFVGVWYGQTTPYGSFMRRADVNIDKIVNILDLSIVARNYGKVDP